MKNFMMVYVTSMSSVVIWSKPIIKNFEALSPFFTQIEQNCVFEPPADYELVDKEYIEPISAKNLKNCFRVGKEMENLKNLPAKLNLDDNVTEFCRSKIVNF